MTPFLPLVLATALSNGEPIHLQIEQIAAAIEIQIGASLEGHALPVGAAHPNLSVWYGPATGPEQAFLRRAASEPRVHSAYTLASPVYRDLP